MNKRFFLAWAVAGLLSAAAAHAQTQVSDAWARATVPGQKASGLFARITSAAGGTLVAVRSPVAGVVEIHEMAMDGTVMRMRALPAGLALPAGQTVELKPGGFHVMLMDLKQPLQPGQPVPVTLVIQGQDGRQETLEVQAPVRALGAPAPGAGHDHARH
jgi:copper(I)-binding protein